ncbi:DNA-3-methyladenine glycosylase 2 family protein [Tateyamaria omphalii]|uniref:DNA-3-methyladenine glycosylase family protein n=1 Tax=Tateyamaria omphalii TaxID=299262 RepID=UPI001C991F42|nr:DNA-3-methyladenine glycosylase 2 family protein [Tateyamaria omphalii]MBY5932353.1 DNA-3-methyladenine glycosylase 2 family protein [Tateyamaria omphalii]
MTAGRIIAADADVAEGAAWLAARDPALAKALDVAGPLPLRRRPDGFAALLNAIIGQQVSTASANAIWGRLEAGGMTSPAPVLAAGEEGLRAAGLSRQKITYAIALAEAGIDYEALRAAPDAEVIATLTAVKGIGVWTAEVYAMFALGRADVFAPGDLALQEAARMIFDLPERPKEKNLRQMAEDWSPWRAVAARLFFTYYRVAKGREGIT